MRASPRPRRPSPRAPGDRATRRGPRAAPARGPRPTASPPRPAPAPPTPGRPRPRSRAAALSSLQAQPRQLLDLLRRVLAHDVARVLDAGRTLQPVLEDVGRDRLEVL